MKKTLGVILLICMLLLTSLSFTTIGEEQNQLRTIYVDDDNKEGPWDGTQEHPYQKIQDGINNGNYNDIVFVKSGLYYENIKTNQVQILKGEDKNNTIIDGRGNGNIITIKTSAVEVDGFTIQNGHTGINIEHWWPQSEINIHDNIIKNNHKGINSEMAENTIIQYNIIEKNRKGVFIDETNNNLIQNNLITNNSLYGIHIDDSSNNKIQENHIKNNSYGIYVGDSDSNTIIRNKLEYNTYNIYFEYGGKGNNFIINNDILFASKSGLEIHQDDQNIKKNFVMNNNFLTNIGHIYIEGTSFWNLDSNKLAGNYYSNWLFFIPYITIGRFQHHQSVTYYFNIDFRPKMIPHSIPEPEVPT